MMKINNSSSTINRWSEENPEQSFLKTISQEKIEQFCQKWQIKKFYLFGSILGSNFNKQSDIDVMVEFFPNSGWGLDFVTMNDELEHIFERKVDLITKKSIERSKNWIRREDILNIAKLIYVQK